MEGQQIVIVGEVATSADQIRQRWQAKYRAAGTDAERLVVALDYLRVIAVAATASGVSPAAARRRATRAALAAADELVAELNGRLRHDAAG